MSTEPCHVWEHLSPQLRTAILAELAAAFQEVIHDYIRTSYAHPPGAQSAHLHSPIHPSASPDQPGESAPSICPTTESDELGWRAEDIEIIDTDLGQTGAMAQNRTGFKEVVSRVTLGEVGIIFSSEVTRLSRNCSDWYPLLDICGYRACLIADRDGIYDPASTNGRLLLGLKGQLSEFELHTIRSRLNAGLLNKAQRGDLCLALPIGLIRQPDGQVLKDPNLEVQERISAVFNHLFAVKISL